MQEYIVRELTKLAPSELIELFTFDCSVIGIDLMYNFHDGTNNNYQPIVFDGQEYTPFPMRVEQMDKDSKQLTRPKLSISNIKGFVSIILLGNQNIIGAAVTRKRVFVRSLDDVNFPNATNPWGTADPTGIVSTDVFYIHRKIAENPDVVQFELATPVEIDNVKLPRRQILALSGSCKYRDPETCGYSGIPVADKSGKQFTSSTGYNLTLNDRGQWSSAETYNAGDYVFMISQLLQTAGDRIYYVCVVNGTTGLEQKPSYTTNWVADYCPKTCRGCKLRFSTGALPIGAFPGTASVRYRNT